jgi:hypothetical protein
MSTEHTGRVSDVRLTNGTRGMRLMADHQRPLLGGREERRLDDEKLR